MSSRRVQTRMGSRALLAVAGAVALAAGPVTAQAGGATLATVSHSLPAASTSCSPGATKLTMWGWAAGYNLAVSQFNKTHPKICVVLSNNGATTGEYTKIQDAEKAGTGTPDVAEIEYFALPSFEITHSLLNLVPYRVKAYRANEVAVAWSQVTQGKAVYAMPVDVGPLVQYYNSTLFAKYGLQPAKTWTQFASEAARLKKADPSAYLATVDWTDIQPVLAMMQQDNAFPFAYKGGSKLGINFTGAAEMRFAKFWQKLLSAQEVNTDPDFSPAQWSDWDNGVNAERFSPAWGPVGMQLSIKKTIGDWRAVPMPQTKAGEVYSGNWGGSTIAVLANTKHPKQAAEFAEWFGGTMPAWKILSGPVAGAFPAYKPLLANPRFLSTTLPISGPQHFQTVFAQAAKHMISPEWPPIMTYAGTIWPTVFAGVTSGKESLPAAFRTLQADLAKYAKAQGFTLTH